MIFSRLLRGTAKVGARQMSGAAHTWEEKLHHMDTWYKLSVTLVPLALLFTGINTYRLEAEHAHHPREEPQEYPYLVLRHRDYPWRDGKRSLIHNPQLNWIPGKGYEEEQHFPK